MKKRISSFDFIRAASALGVFLFHLTIALSDYFPESVPHRLPDQTGFLFVTCFFVLSGSLLEYRYGSTLRNRKDRTAYLKKRALTIYPAFYLCFIPLFLIAAVRHHSFFFRGTKWPLLLSLIGLDGYFSASVTTYYMIGEWFLGGLILMYLIYPVISEGTPIRDFASGAGIFLIYILTCQEKLLAVSPLANLPSCFISFYAGVLFIRYHVFERKRDAWILTFLTGGFTFFFRGMGERIPYGITFHFAGFALFLILYLTGGQIRWRGIAAAGDYTYEFFLVHHMIIDRLTYWCSEAAGADSSGRAGIAAAAGAGSFLLSAAAAWAVHRITRHMLRFLKKVSIT